MLDAVQDFLGYLYASHRLVVLTTRGAALISQTDLQLRTYLEGPALVDVSQVPDAPDVIGDLARTERDAEFPLLHAHALMGTWGAFEACIDEICVGWLIESQAHGAREAMAKIKVPIEDFFWAEDPERARKLLDALQRHRSTALKPGVGQFEDVIRAIGIGGAVDPSLRDVLHYTKAIRNVIAHRAGNADARLVTECAALGLTVGEEIRIGTLRYAAATHAMGAYAEHLRDRIARTAGEDVDTSPDLSRESCSTILQEFMGPAEGAAD